MVYSIDNLVEQTGFSKRTIRFYIQEKLLDPPTGNTRGAVYSVDHLERLLTIRRLTKQGHSLNGIKSFFSNLNSQQIEPNRPGTLEVWTKITIRDGIEINVNGMRAQMDSDELRSFTRDINSLSKKYSKEK